jgi:hypothetical protein
MAEDVYRMQHRWVIRGSIETVFRYVSDSRTYLDWFTVFQSVEADDPVGPIRVGSHTRMRVKAQLPYTLDWDVTVVEYDPPHEEVVAIKVTLGLAVRDARQDSLHASPAARRTGRGDERARNRRRPGGTAVSAPAGSGRLRVQPSVGDGPGRAAAASYRRWGERPLRVGLRYSSLRRRYSRAPRAKLG